LLEFTDILILVFISVSPTRLASQLHFSLWHGIVCSHTIRALFRY